MRQVRPGVAVCDDHPELGELGERAAYDHLVNAHPDTARWGARVVEESTQAGDGTPRRHRGGQRRKRKRKRR